MFDIGFWELVVVAIVALLVVGPERLPGLVRSVGFWVGRFRKIASTVKSELQQELDKAERLQNLLDEQKKIVERHEILSDLRNIENDINDKPQPIPIKPKAVTPPAVDLPPAVPAGEKKPPADPVSPVTSINDKK